MNKIIIFTDLDGTLLNEENFSYKQIITFIKNLLKSDYFFIFFISSKTKEEMINLRKKMNINVPLIYENGAGIYDLKFCNLIKEPLKKNIVLAKQKIKEIKKKINLFCGLKSNMRFLDLMDIKELKRILGLHLDEIQFAIDRKFSRLFLFDGEESNLKNQAKEHGLSINKGGRVYSISDNFTKADAFNFIKKKIKKNYPHCNFIGLGDSENDKKLLEAVDLACIIKNKNKKLKLNKKTNFIYRSKYEAPFGWREIIKKVTKVKKWRKVV
jgi:mannosyl-3-phosphoglycerate phosphatase